MAPALPTPRRAVALDGDSKAGALALLPQERRSAVPKRRRHPWLDRHAQDQETGQREASLWSARVLAGWLGARLVLHWAIRQTPHASSRGQSAQAQSVAGTRVPAAVILAQLGAGVPESELCREYDLTPEQIRAAVRYGAWLAEQDEVRAVG